LPLSPKKRILQWDIVDIGKAGVSHNKIDGQTAKRLVAALVEREQLFKAVEVVIIERQPPLAKLMRVIQGMLEVFFLTGIGSEALPNLTDVQQFDGRSKIQHAKLKGLSGNEKYKLRKQEAIRETTEFLASTAQSEEAKRTFASSKKKDDLADSLIQGLRYLELCGGASRSES
jgi:hypothetical protein